jgi:hypothetical protein
MLSEATLEYGARTMQALLGIDRLYRDESGDETGLVVLNMDTEGRFPPDRFGGYAEARACFTELEREADALPEDDRKLYYGQLSRSTLAFIEWRTNGLSFEAQLGDFLHVPVAPASDERLDHLRAEIRTALTEMGYKGGLQAQAAAWEERTRVPPESVEEVLTELLDEAWDRTEAFLGRMPADRSDAMGVEAVSGEAYNARCDYLARTIQINVDPVLTKPSLKHLAVHEGYPGHYLQFKVRETMTDAGTAAPDVLLSVVNTASSSVFEGIADHGARMIGWETSLNDTVQSLMTQYRAGIGTGAAWRLHGLDWSEADATEWLHEQSLVGGEGWVLNRMAFIKAPPRAVLIWSYWWGEQSVRAAFDAVAEGDRPAFFDFLYGRMHSTKSVRMFEATRA